MSSSEEVEEGYWWGEYGEYRVMIRYDGYINVSKLCKIGGKEFRDWNKNKTAKDLLNLVSHEIGKPSSYSIHGGPESKIRGTYAHPSLVDSIVPWIQKAANLRPEEAAVERVMEHHGGISEVSTPDGFIDILTDNAVIEVKNMKSWMHAVGQVQIYGDHYPDREKWIYLFGDRGDVAYIRKRCAAHDIKVFHVDDLIEE